jgi:adenylate cyclase
MSFANIGPVENNYFGHGVATDIQHYLTRCHDLLVSGRSSAIAMSSLAGDATDVAEKLGVQYVLQGTVRTRQDRIRLTVELVDGASGAVLWSERYDRVLTDILEIEAEVAGAITASLSLKIEEAQYERHRHLSGDQLSAYNLRLRGNRFLELAGKDNLERARECFTNALKLEPHSAPAFAGLSVSYGYECDQLVTANYGASLERHVEFAERAVALDETDSRSHYAMYCANLFSGRFESADLHAKRALELNPSEYHNLCGRGYTLMSLGRIDESLASFNQSLRRNPLAPNSCLRALGVIEYLETNYDQSAVAISRMTNSNVQKTSTLAAARAQLGQSDEARDVALEFNRVSKVLPGCPTGRDTREWQTFWRRAFPYLKDEAIEHLLEGFRMVNLPG